MLSTIGDIPAECLSLEYFEDTKERGITLSYTGTIVPGYHVTLMVANHTVSGVEFSAVLYARELLDRFSREGPPIQDYLEKEDKDKRETFRHIEESKSYREKLPSYEGAWSTACDES